MDTQQSNSKEFSRSPILPSVLAIMLLLLWIPVLVDQLWFFGVFKERIERQPFSLPVRQAIRYLLPATEMVTLLSLLFVRTRLVGFSISFLLMVVFTGYIAAGLWFSTNRFLCTCSSVISGMSWTAHFWFNCLFLILSAYGIVILLKKTSARYQE